MAGFSLASCMLSDRTGDTGTTLWSDSDGDLERRVIASRWDTLAAYVGHDRDTVLNYPHRIAAHAGGVYVFDDGARRLLSFDSALCLRHTAGRRGAGPFEFSGVRDLVATPDGGAAVLDAANGRITVYGPGAVPRRMVAVRDVAGPEQMVVLDENRYLIHASADPRTPFVVIDSAGNKGDRIAFPWKGYQKLSHLSTYGRLARDPHAPDRWAFVFVYGNGWFAFDGVQPRDVPGRFVEHTPFPVPRRVPDGIQLPTNTLVSSLDSAIDGDALYVLFGGRDPNSAYTMIDRFDLRDGSYHGSYELPRQALAISYAEGSFYVLFREPHPSLYRLRPITTNPTDGRPSGATASATPVGGEVERDSRC